MRPQTRLSVLLTMFMAVLLALGALNAPPANARPLAQDSPPPNDNFAAALSFDGSYDSRMYFLLDATREADEMDVCLGVAHTVWYRFTPQAQTTIRVTTFNSAFDWLAVELFEGESLNGLTPRACSTDSASTFILLAGTTYYLRISASEYTFGGVTTVTIDELLPAPNDAFAAATPIDALPFTAEAPIEAATTEVGEPTLPCGSGSEGTVWFAFTAPESRTYVATSSSAAWPGLGIYTGSYVADLQLVGSGCYGGSAVLRAAAGTTYYLQIGELWGAPTTVTLSLDVAPTPSVFMQRSPWEPSITQDVQFEAWIHDPVGQSVESWSWSFGDGGTSTEASPTHRYAADGDYTVRLVVMTVDGRTASAELLLAVRTHDVTVTKLSVPRSARVGNAHEISVSITSDLTAEYVRVQLYKSIGQGLIELGNYVQYVPVRSGNRTTSFSFNYVFMPEDGQAGSVTFTARADIITAPDGWLLWDSFPADNEKTATTLKVSR